MSLEALRAKALAYSPELTYPIILDRDLKYRLSEATQKLADLRKDRAKMADLPPEEQARAAGQTLADAAPRFRIDTEIADAEKALSDIEDEARPEALVLIFRRLPASGPDSYQQALEDNSDAKGVVSIFGLGQALLASCYLRTEDAAGADVGLTWDEAQIPLDHGDIEALRSHIINHHRVGTAISFDPRSSGRPATS